MNHILFDLLGAQPKGAVKYHGGGEHMKAVFVALANSVANRSDCSMSCFYNNEKYIDEYILNTARQCGIDCVNVSSYDDVAKLSCWNSADTIYLGLFEPQAFRHLTFPARARVIATYHGFRELEMFAEKNMPRYATSISTKIKSFLKLAFSRTYYKWKRQQTLETIEICDDLIGVSSFSQYSALMMLPELSVKKMHTFWAPAKPLKSEAVSPRIDSPYILMISANRWTKNAIRGASAADYLFDRGYLPNYKVVITGNYPIKEISKLKHKDRFVFEGYTSPEQLEGYFKHCDIFLYPSLNEGFGYPPGEAMKYGKTCVVSAVTSLTEIYGESVYWCNPYDEKEIATRILEASVKKIDSRVISNRLELICEKQNKDLSDLCSLIMDTKQGESL